ncbi:MAG TPA: hypothetical protein PLV92_25735, partial [Pirellulaceae bacterium]|nr:hypothetical protein [Pirellulaceae bacterium]
MLRSSLLLLLACAALQEVVPWHSTTSVVAQEPPQLQYLTGHAAPVYAVGVAPDGKTIVSASVDGQLKAWDRATGEAVATWSSGDRAPLALAVSPDGLSVAVGGLDRTVRLFDLPRRHPRSEWTGVPGVPAALLLSADVKIVFTADSSGNVRAWDAAMKTVVRDFAGAPGPLGGATLLSSTGQVIAIGGDGILRGWKVADASATGAVSITPALGVAAAPDEKRLAVAAHDGLVRLVRWPPVA